MFKLIFKIISFIVILIVIIVALAVWKGGEPFRWIGKKIENVGKSIESFGDMVDEIKEGQKKAAEKFIELKESLDSIQNNKQEQSKNKNGTTNKH
jgi:hypothetical protein